jgi:hypothetical protein
LTEALRRTEMSLHDGQEARAQAESRLTKSVDDKKKFEEAKDAFYKLRALQELEKQRAENVAMTMREVKCMFGRSLSEAEIIMEAKEVLAGCPHLLKSPFNFFIGSSLLRLGKEEKATKYFESSKITWDTKGACTVDGSGYDLLCSMCLWLLEKGDGSILSGWPFHNMCKEVPEALLLQLELACCSLFPRHRESILALSKPRVRSLDDPRLAVSFHEQMAELLVSQIWENNNATGERETFLGKQLAQLYVEFPQSASIEYVMCTHVFLLDRAGSVMQNVEIRRTRLAQAVLLGRWDFFVQGNGFLKEIAALGRLAKRWAFNTEDFH